MKFHWTTEITQQHHAEIKGLMDQEWWCKNRSLDEVSLILEGSDISLAAIDSNHQIIAYLRVLTDFAAKALIFDAIVKNGYRELGLGSAMIAELRTLKALRNVKSFELYCPDTVAGFYEKSGFKKSNSHLMMLKR